MIGTGNLSLAYVSSPRAGGQHLLATVPWVFFVMTPSHSASHTLALPLHCSLVYKPRGKVTRTSFGVGSEAKSFWCAYLGVSGGGATS